MTRTRPMTPREVEQARTVARDYPEGTRATVYGLVATIEDLRRKLEAAEQREQRAKFRGY